MRIGVDLGGTKIEAIALDDAGEALLRRRIETPAGDYAGTVKAVADLVFAIESEIGARGSVGIGTPGALSFRTGLLKNSNSTVLNGKPLDVDTSNALARPVRLENDANCFALSEAMDGAGAGEPVVFGIILGTGVGGGLVVNRKLVAGANRIAGEWGHNPLPWPRGTEYSGPRCYCGKTGCIETFLSGPALARDYRTLTGRDADAKAVAALAEQGEGYAADIVDLYRDRLARSLAMVINIVDPDTLVFGGGLSNATAIYDGLLPLIEHYAFSDSLRTKLSRAVHGDSSGVRGAAWLWPSMEGE